MKSLSLATLSLTFLLSVSSGAQAQKPGATKATPPAATTPSAVKPTPAPAPTTPSSTVAPVTLSPTGSAPLTGASPAPTTTASPAPDTQKTSDPESQSLTSYVSPLLTTTDTKTMAQDLGIKLGGVIGLMFLSALGWKTLRRRGVGSGKSSSKERTDAHLLVMEKLHLNPQQVLYVIRYAERTLLVGSSPQNLNLLTDLTNGGTSLAMSMSAALPAPVTEAIKEIETRSERVKPSPEPAIRTPRPVATEDRFAGILDRLRAQEEPSMPSEYRVQPSRPSRTIAELDEDEEERLLAKSHRGGSLFRAAEKTAAGDRR